MLDSAIKGHGTGFRAQRSRKSTACLDGRMMRLAWRWDGARPEVDFVYILFREARRAAIPVESDESLVTSLVWVIVAVVDMTQA